MEQTDKDTEDTFTCFYCREKHSFDDMGDDPAVDSCIPCSEANGDLCMDMF